MTGQVSRMRGLTPDGQMGAVGYVIAAGVAVVLLPILPVVVVLWFVAKLLGGDRRDETYEAHEA